MCIFAVALSACSHSAASRAVALRDTEKTHTVPLMRVLEKKIRAFRSSVWSYWKENGRHDLPWRKTKDPYRILVSEVMLQQTQVPRVIEKYKEFLKAFPTIRTLAKASLSDVLKVWSGMGYNRRAKFLRDAAISIVQNHKGRIPNDLVALRSLPGIGAYTASAVRVFAFNLPDVLIETNVRAAIIHHFFTHTGKVSDSMAHVYAAKAAEGQDPRRWHAALMDYGVHIKKLHQNPTRKSLHYLMQSQFEGSMRQVRGAILKILNAGPHGDIAISKKLSFEGSKVRKALTSLARDGLVRAQKGSWQIA